MIEKIDIIINTGTLPIIKEQKLKIHTGTGISIDTVTKKHAVNDIQNILGFGEKIASQLKLKYGITNIQQLRKMVFQNKIQLTNAQQLGLKYHNDLQHKISRDETTKIGKIISNTISNSVKDKIHSNNKPIFVYLAGSYPSGVKESKDIDILIVSRDSKYKLEDIIYKLKNNNHMKLDSIELDTISLGHNKFLGVVKLQQKGYNIWHHLDIRFVNIKAFPYAWLHYTGGKIFNKLIRTKFKRKGYKLNETGLYQNGKQVILEDELNNVELVKIIQNEKQLLEYSEKIEKQIFTLANLEYKTIPERY
jgi:DNA polymerase/3'-5' exonuclease PolX